MSQNWRTQVDAQDHFGQQKRLAEIEKRRPVIRRPADIGLGPGINASAVRVTNWDDILAQYDGYFSAEAGAAGAPDSGEAFVGLTIGDATLGGVQQATGLVSGNHYRRVFVRNPSDPRSVSFGDWARTNAPAAPPIGVESLTKTTPSLISAAASWRVDSFNLERWGRHAVLRLSVTLTGSTIALSNVEHGNQQVATIIDTTWRPLVAVGTITYDGFRAALVDTNGAISLTAGLRRGAPNSTNTDISNGDTFDLGVSYLLPKTVV